MIGQMHHSDVLDFADDLAAAGVTLDPEPETEHVQTRMGDTL